MSKWRWWNPLRNDWVVLVGLMIGVGVLAYWWVVK